VTHQLLACADDVNLLGDNKETIKKNTETLTETSKKFSLEANAKETKYMLLSRYKNAGYNHDIKTGSKSSGNVAQFKHFETTVTNNILIQYRIKKIEFW
jgi:hypothetical protein